MEAISMKLDRDLQKEILTTLSEHYPGRAQILPQDDSEERIRTIAANLIYLEEHGLVESGVKQYMDGKPYSTGSRITAAGIDFLADDGGLSAILGVVTVKFSEDTLRALIANRISDADLPPTDKQRLLDQLRDLRAESIKHLTMKLLDKGMENWPAALLAIQTFLQSGLK
jgi:hypothetical protein